MKKNIFELLAVMALLTPLLYTACSSEPRSEERKQPGVHHMGPAPMSDAKMPGKIPMVTADPGAAICCADKFAIFSLCDLWLCSFTEGGNAECFHAGPVSVSVVERFEMKWIDGFHRVSFVMQRKCRDACAGNHPLSFPAQMLRFR